MVSALVLIDMQEALCREDGAIGAPSGLGAEVVRRGVLESAARGLAAAREANLLVAHVMVSYDSEATQRVPTTKGSGEVAQVLVETEPHTSICDEVLPLPGEPVIVKAWVDPFVGTPLDALLRRGGAQRLFLGGVTTTHAVESAARHASDLGYDVNVVDDMCASMSQEMHEYSMNTALPVFGRKVTEVEFLSAIR